MHTPFDIQTTLWHPSTDRCNRPTRSSRYGVLRIRMYYKYGENPCTMHTYDGLRSTGTVWYDTQIQRVLKCPCPMHWTHDKNATATTVRSRTEWTLYRRTRFVYKQTCKTDQFWWGSYLRVLHLVNTTVSTAGNGNLILKYEFQCKIRILSFDTKHEKIIVNLN